MIKLNYHNTQDIKNSDFENKYKLLDQKIDSVIKELKALNIVFDNMNQMVDVMKKEFDK